MVGSLGAQSPETRCNSFCNNAAHRSQWSTMLNHAKPKKTKKRGNPCKKWKSKMRCSPESPFFRRFVGAAVAELRKNLNLVRNACCKPKKVEPSNFARFRASSSRYIRIVFEYRVDMPWLQNVANSNELDKLVSKHHRLEVDALEGLDSFAGQDALFVAGNLWHPDTKKRGRLLNRLMFSSYSRFFLNQMM